MQVSSVFCAPHLNKFNVLYCRGFSIYFLGTENGQNGMKNSTNEVREVISQPGDAIGEDLKQQENVNDSFSSENSVLETSTGRNSVVAGMSTNWYFVLLPVKLQ